MEDGLEMHKDVSENCLIGNYSFLGGRIRSKKILRGE